MGSSEAALWAGYSPKPTPIAEQTNTPRIAQPSGKTTEAWSQIANPFPAMMALSVLFSGVQRVDELSETLPRNLDADTEENQGGEPEKDDGTRLAEGSG